MKLTFAVPDKVTSGPPGVIGPTDVIPSVLARLTGLA